MADISQTQQQIASANAQAQQVAAENAKARQSLQQAQTQLQSQRVVRQLSGIEGLRQRQLAQTQLNQSSEILKQREQAVSAYQQQIATAQSKVQAYTQAQSDLKTAEDVYTGKAPVFALQSAQSKSFYQQLQANKRDAINATLNDLESQGVDAQTLSSIENEMRNNLGKVSSTQLKMRIDNMLQAQPSLNQPKIEAPIVKEFTWQPEVYGTIAQAKVTGEAHLAPKQFDILGIKNKQAELQAAELGGEKINKGSLFLTSALSAPVNIIGSIKNLGKSKEPLPLTLYKSLYKAPASIIKNAPALGQTLRESPSTALGQIAFNVALTKGIGSGIRVVAPKALGALNLPKIETKFVSQEAATQAIPSGERVLLNTVARSEVKGLIRTKQVLSAAQSDLRVANDLSYTSGTRGVLREKSLFGNWKEPSKFGSVELGQAEERQLNILVSKDKNIVVTRPVEQGYLFKSFGKTINAGAKKPTYYFSAGVTGEINPSKSFAFGYSNPIKVSGSSFKRIAGGKGTSLGIIERNIPNREVIIQEGRAIQKSNFPFQTTDVAKLQQKTAIESAIKQNYLTAATEKAVNFAKPLVTVVKATTKGTSEILKSESSQIFVRPQIKQSLYYGTGQYEKTNEVVSTMPRQAQNNIQLFKFRAAQNQLSDLSQKQESKLRLGTTQINPSAQGQAQSLRLGALQSQKQAQQQKQAQYQRTYLSTRTPFIKPRIPFIKFKKGFRKAVSDDIIKGFKTWVIRNKKKEYLPGTYSKYEATRLGEAKVLGSLRATFGIEPSNQLIRGKNFEYKPSERIFRKAKYLKDAWVQKSGTRKEPTIKGARFASYGERAEIRLARKNKKKAFFR